VGSLAVALLDAQRATEPGAPARERSGWSTVDDDRIRAFVAGEYRQVVATVELVCGSLATAEDAVQEALARAWERSERGEQIESLRAWVMKVAINLVRSGFRRMLAERRARDRLLAGRSWSGQSIGPSVSGAEDALDIERALARLPRRQREATVLRYYLDLSVLEVAHALGVNEGTAKTTLFRARKALGDALGEPAGRLHEESEGVGRI